MHVVSMREVYCVGYTTRAWNPRSLQSILDVPLCSVFAAIKDLNIIIIILKLYYSLVYSHINRSIVICGGASEN